MTDPSASPDNSHSRAHVHAPGDLPHVHDLLEHHAEASMPRLANSVLGWPAWQRMLAVLPVVALLWLAVWWASAEVKPW